MHRSGSYTRSFSRNKWWFTPNLKGNWDSLPKLNVRRAVLNYPCSNAKGCVSLSLMVERCWFLWSLLLEIVMSALSSCNMPPYFFCSPSSKKENHRFFRMFTDSRFFNGYVELHLVNQIWFRLVWLRSRTSPFLCFSSQVWVFVNPDHPFFDTVWNTKSWFYSLAVIELVLGKLIKSLLLVQLCIGLSEILSPKDLFLTRGENRWRSCFMANSDIFSFLWILLFAKSYLQFRVSSIS